MTGKLILGALCAIALAFLTLLQTPAAVSATLQPSGLTAQKTVTLAQRGNRFNRCMQRCFQKGYNTRLCPEKCGAL